MKRLSIPDRELKIFFSRSSGAGGQNVNKVETKATLQWNILRSAMLTDGQKNLLCRRLAHRMTGDGFIAVSSQAERGQHANREHARRLLEQLVSKALTPRKQRIHTAVPRRERERRLDLKRKKSEKKRLRRPEPI
ncbi:aminoacyl-tRNA hydrolase [Patescibacteria group bacterium]|nr:aminoacyl-tRNA hydrolase [Patescibacteria group bacterium]